MKTFTAAEKRIIRKAMKAEPGYRERAIIAACVKVEAFPAGKDHKCFTLYAEDGSYCVYDMVTNKFVG